MAQAVPLQAVPNQTVYVVLGGQNCRVAVYQKTTGLYADLYVDNAPVFTTVACLRAVPLVDESYMGFVGYLVFVDSLGRQDPDYTGLGPGGRFSLLYLTSADL